MVEYMAVKRESNGLKKSCMPALLFLALVASFLFLVCIPSFFMVSGRSTCLKKPMKFHCNKISRNVFSSYTVQFVVQPTSIADGLSIVIPPPQRGGGRFAVGARGPLPPGGALQINRIRVVKNMAIKMPPQMNNLTRRLLGLIRGLFWPFIL